MKSLEDVARERYTSGFVEVTEYVKDSRKVIYAKKINSSVTTRGVFGDAKLYYKEMGFEAIGGIRDKGILKLAKDCRKYRVTITIYEGKIPCERDLRIAFQESVVDDWGNLLLSFSRLKSFQG